jgi:hypothetical protein
MGNSTDTSSFTDQTTKSTANSLTNFLNTMAKQYASNVAQNTTSTQTYSPSDVAKAMLAKATQPITSEQIAQYTSPYQKDVIDATMAQLAQQYGVQQNALTGNAIAQNALGGDRAKIAQAALMGEQGRNTASTLAGLEQAGYTQALSAAQADQARLLQAAGLSGGTTVGGQQMTGTTAGTETGTTQGTATSAQSGTSHTVGQGSSTTNSNPNIFGAPLNFANNWKDGGHVQASSLVKRRDAGGETYGVPSWAMPPPLTTSAPMQMIVAPSGGGKNMSTKDMIKLGDKARGQLDKMFSAEKASSGPSSEAAAGDFSGAGSAGTAETGAVASDAGVTAVDASAAGADAAAGTGEAAGALGKGAAGAGEAAGAGAGEAAGGAGKGAMSAMAALLAKDGGAIRHRSGGGGMDMPGISMQEGIGQEWFKVPTMDPTSGIKGSASGGAIRRRADGGADDFYDPYAPISSDVGVGDIRRFSSLTAGADEGPVDKPLPRSEADMEARRAALQELRSQSGRAEEPAQPSISEKVKEWWSRPSTPEGSVQLGDLTAPVAQRKPNIGDLVAAPGTEVTTPWDTAVEPAIKMATTTQVDPSTGKPLSTDTAEPGAEEIAPDSTPNYAKTVVETLRANGATDSAIQGILANAQDESGFNPALRHPDQPHFTGEAHYAHGIYQMGGEEWNKYAAWLSKNHPNADWRDTKLQTQFMAENLKVNYPKVWKAMNEGTPEEAAQAYLTGYLKPAEKHRVARMEKYGNGVLGIDEYTSTPSTVSSREEPASPKSGGQSLAALAPVLDKAKDPNAPAMAAATAGSAPPEGGNFLSRILEAGFNPLKMSDRDLTFIAQTALGGLGGINKAAETAQGTRQMDINAQNKAVELAMEAQRLQHTMAQPVVTGETADDFGNVRKQYGVFNPKTNAYEPVSVTSPAPGGQGPSGVPQFTQQISQAYHSDKTGDEFIKLLPPAVGTTAKKIGDYEIAPPTGKAAQSGPGAQALALAEKYNPSYDASQFKTRQSLKQSFTSGKDADEIKSYNMVSGHLADADALVDKLGNFRSSLINKPYNAVRGQLSGEFIKNKSAIDAKLDTAINEVNKATSGKAITRGEQKLWHDRLSADTSPEGMHATLRSFSEMIHDRMEATANKWNSGMGLKEGSEKYLTVERMLSPQALEKHNRIMGTETAPQAERPAGVSKVQQMTQAEPKPEAVQFLIKNPSTSSYFDAKYGPGAAKKVMSTQGAS